jgi:ABC-type transport system substrate-binding protein
MAEQRTAPRGSWRVGLLVAAVLAAGCNSPYPESEEGQNILYSTFAEEPKHLDPARAYATDECELLCQALEPPFQYHFLKRPYELAPLVAEEIPKPEGRTVTFQGRQVEATVYTIRLKRGVLYQDHPCFVEANRRLTDASLRGVRAVRDIRPTAARELVAGDFVHAVRRLADPRLACPIESTLAQHLVGLREYEASLQAVLDRERAKRKAAAGVLYNQEKDEQYHPIPVDYGAGAERFPFAREVDRYTFELVLWRPYPQILYWMAMPFFAPVPPEATAFFDQPVLLERSLIFDKNPVGTGPYALREFDPTNQIVFERHEHFRDERFPELPQPAVGDETARALYDQMKEAGLGEDAGTRLPMIDRVVLRMEKESIPRWNKFLQGYYDAQGIPSDVFDQAVKLTSQGDASLADEMAARGIQLRSSYSTTSSFLVFNMGDSVVGGYTDAGRKLRQAISIAYDSEEEIAIFLKEQGVPSQSPIPPGIFGYREGREGINPVVYEWDEARGRGVRRSVDEAKRLLAEAGYPNGYGPDGQRLVLRFPVSGGTPEGATWLAFVKKQFDKLNIGLEIEVSDWNRFRDKIDSGNFQVSGGGWVADYPDPENFLFLLYGPSAKTVSKGENAANYKNPRFDELFAKMRSMENSPERLALVDEMVRLLQQDAPWVFRYHPKSLAFYHGWVKNAWPHALAFNTWKYRRLDTAARTAYRRAENQPRWWPILALAAVLVLGSLPALRAARRRMREG